MATQGAQAWHEMRAQNTDLMLAELKDGRDFVKNIPTPTTSAEAEKSIALLQRELTVFQSSQARMMMQNTIALLDTSRAALLETESKAAEAKKAADDAAALAAKQQADAAAAQRAQQANQAAAAAEQAHQAQVKTLQRVFNPASGVSIGGLHF